MAQAVEQNWRGTLSGLVVTRYGYAVPCTQIEIVEAAHPVPDAAGMHAAQRMLELVGRLSADDLVLCLISGGGSALLPLPAKGLTLDLKQNVSRALLASGATISEMNCVRRHLSAIKGGRLAAACYPAQVLTLLISDVPGDRPLDIASGPTVADPTTSRGRAEHRAPLRHSTSASRARAARKWARRIREARRSAACARPHGHGRHAANGAGGGRRRGPRCGNRSPYIERCHRG